MKIVDLLWILILIFTIFRTQSDTICRWIGILSKFPVHKRSQAKAVSGGLNLPPKQNLSSNPSGGGDSVDFLVLEHSRLSYLQGNFLAIFGKLGLNFRLVGLQQVMLNAIILKRGALSLGLLLFISVSCFKLEVFSNGLYTLSHWKGLK